MRLPTGSGGIAENQRIKKSAVEEGGGEPSSGSTADETSIAPDYEKKMRARDFLSTRRAVGFVTIRISWEQVLQNDRFAARNIPSNQLASVAAGRVELCGEIRSSRAPAVPTPRQREGAFDLRRMRIFG
jgi:hypothetical protein